MSAALIEQAAAAGVRLALTPAGTIKASGDAAAVARWIETIRDNKPAIVAALGALPALPTCRQCRRLASNGQCRAAPRRYSPAPDVGLRCRDYRPLPADSDQRNGRERWPWLTE
jgi:hypothetical protein